MPSLACGVKAARIIAKDITILINGHEVKIQLIALISPHHDRTSRVQPQCFSNAPLSPKRLLDKPDSLVRLLSKPMCQLMETMYQAFAVL